MLVREVDRKLRLTERMAPLLPDPRRDKSRIAEKAANSRDEVQGYLAFVRLHRPETAT
jgi:hypothetical protein